VHESIGASESTGVSTHEDADENDADEHVEEEDNIEDT
jgi:hypothetical protein